MANEFVARKGLISSGSIDVSGSVTAYSFTGSFKGDGSQLINIPVTAQTPVFVLETNTFTGDGTTKIFTLAKPYNSASVVVTMEGLTQTNTLDYTITGTTLTFVVTPPSQSNINAIAFINITTGSIGTFSGSFLGNIESASYALTASYAMNGGGVADWNTLSGKPAGIVSSSTQITNYNIFATTGSNRFNGTQTITGSVILSSSATTELQVIGNTEITGSLNVTNGITGSLLGTSSWARDAITASFALSTTGTVQNATSASTATTASYVLPSGLPSGVISSSTQVQLNAVTGTTFSNASFLFPQNVTIEGRLTAQEFYTELVSSSIIYESGSTKFGNSADDVHQFTGSLRITGSITGSLFGTSSWATNALTSSTATSSSYALTASYALNAVGGGTGAGFPFSGSAVITGSLYVTGSPTGSTVFRVAGQSGDLFSVDDSLTGTLFAVTKADNNPIIEALSDGTIIFGTGSGDMFITNSLVGIGRVPVTGGPELQVSGGMNLTGSLNVLGTISGSIVFPSGLLSSSAQTSTGSFTGSFVGTHTGSYSGSYTGSLLGTSSWATNAITATSASTATSSSYAVTASFALNASSGGSGAGFPFSGSAIITGSLFITGSPTGSTVFRVAGQSGDLFSVDDSLTGTLFAVTKADNNPIIEALSDGTVIFGTGSGDIFYTSSYIGIGRIPVITAGSPKLQVSGSTVITGSLNVTAGITGSISGSVNTAISSSYALTASYALNSAGGGGTGAGFPYTGSAIITGSLSVYSSSALTNPESNIGIYHSFFNNSSAINTGVGLSLGSNNDLGVVFVAQRTGNNNEHTLKIQTRDNTGTSATRVTVLGAGNVGIGTLTPSASLQVQGNISASSYTSSISNAVGFLGTSSWAVTASYALNAAGGGGGASFPYTGSAIISGSLLVTGSTNVLGAFSATTKSFKINHQILSGKQLIYGVLEGPEHAVYARGRLTAHNTIKLPDEWSWLVDMNTLTVQLTPIGTHQKLYVKEIVNGVIFIENDNMLNSNIDCFYFVQATRKDVEPLQTVV